MPTIPKVSCGGSHEKTFRLQRTPMVIPAFILLCAVLGAVFAGTAAASPPQRLSEQVVDETGALAGMRDEVETVFADVYSSTGVRVYVVFVGSFDGVPGAQWAKKTADKTGSGAKDIVFAVATEDREYGTSQRSGFPLGRSAVDGIIESDVLLRLSDGEWAQAATGLAYGLQRELGAGASAGSSDSGDSSSSIGSDSSSAWVLLVIVGLAAVGFGAWFIVKRRKERQRLKELERTASKAVVDVDSAIREADQELAFAQAQFAADVVAPLADQIAQAKEDVDGPLRAFNDQAPDVGSALRTPTVMNIIRACDSALAALAAQTERLRDLAEIAKDVPRHCQELKRKVEVVRGLVPQARSTLVEVKSLYLGPQVEELDAGVAEVGMALETVSHRVRQAEDGLTAGRQANELVGAVEQARIALERANALIDHTAGGARELNSAANHCGALTHELESLIAVAKVTADGAKGLGSVPPLIARINMVSGMLAQGAPIGLYDPVARRDAMQSHVAVLSQALQQVRAEQAEIAAAAEARRNRRYGGGWAIGSSSGGGFDGGSSSSGGSFGGGSSSSGGSFGGGSSSSGGHF